MGEAIIINDSVSSKDKHSLGDIITMSYQLDDDNYLQCDGRVISKRDYPLAQKVLQSNSPWSSVTMTLPSNVKSTGGKEDHLIYCELFNRYYYHYEYKTSSDNFASVLYTSTDLINWTELLSGSGAEPEYNYYLNSFTYNGAFYIACGISMKLVKLTGDGTTVQQISYSNCGNYVWNVSLGSNGKACVLSTNSDREYTQITLLDLNTNTFTSIWKGNGYDYCMSRSCWINSTYVYFLIYGSNASSAYAGGSRIHRISLDGSSHTTYSIGCASSNKNAWSLIPIRTLNGIYHIVVWRNYTASSTHMGFQEAGCTIFHTDTCTFTPLGNGMGFVDTNVYGMIGGDLYYNTNAPGNTGPCYRLNSTDLSITSLGNHELSSVRYLDSLGSYSRIKNSRIYLDDNITGDFTRSFTGTNSVSNYSYVYDDSLKRICSTCDTSGVAKSCQYSNVDTLAIPSIASSENTYNYIKLK